MGEEKKEQNYELVKVPTEYGLGFKTPNEEVLNTEQALIEILNKLEKIEKAVA